MVAWAKGLSVKNLRVAWSDGLRMQGLLGLRVYTLWCVLLCVHSPAMSRQQSLLLIFYNIHFYYTCRLRGLDVAWSLCPRV